MKNLENAKELYQMINSGQIVEAFEKFYNQNVVMQEIGEEPRIGKDVNRQNGLNFLETVKTFHNSGVTNISSNEEKGVTMVESWMDVTFHGDVEVKIEQVAVQTWQGNEIIKEVFYHK